MNDAALLVNLFTTLVLVGLIWVVQLALYPLFAEVGTAGFLAYHCKHSERITWIVGPLMAAELVSSIVLAASPPAAIGHRPFVLGLLLVLVVWASTAFVQVPAHAALGAGFSKQVHRRLVRTNWIRTVAWSARGALLLWVVGRLLPPNR